MSHRLEEVLALADRITVMRDGAVVDHGPKEAYSIEELIRKMVGREVDHLFHRQRVNAPGNREVFAVCLLGDRKLLKDISFSVKEGEILGVAGLPGSGKDELVDCLAGLRPFTGQILIRGKARSIRSPADLLRHGVAIVPAGSPDGWRDPGFEPVRQYSISKSKKTQSLRPASTERDASACE